MLRLVDKLAEVLEGGTLLLVEGHASGVSMTMAT